MERLRQSHSEDMERLRQSHSEDMERLRQSHSEDMENLRKSHAEEMEKMRLSFERRLDRMAEANADWPRSSAMRWRPESLQEPGSTQGHSLTLIHRHWKC